MRKSASLLVVVALLLGCTGGGGDAAPPATDGPVELADPVQPCEVLTPELAGTALALDLEEGERLEDGNRLGCDYFTTDGDPVAAVFHEVGVGPLAFGERVATGRATESALTVVQTAADLAFFATDGRAVVARLGDAMIQVHVVGPQFATPALSEAVGVELIDAFVAALDPGRAAPGPRTTPLAVDDPDPDEEPAPSWVEAVETGVEGGRWERGEGLARALSAVLGDDDTDAFEDVDDPSLTELVAVVDEYLASSPGAAADELTALLDTIRFSEDRLQAMTMPGAVLGGGSPAEPEPGEDESAGASPGSPAVTPVGFQISGTDAEPDGTADCAKFFPESRGGIEACLALRTVVEQGIEYRLYGPGPDENLPGSVWTDRHYDWATQAIRDSIQLLSPHGSVPGGYIVFSRLDLDASSAAYQANPCYVSVMPNMASETEPDFRQIIAHEIGHCFQGAAVPDDGYPATAWLVESMAEYLANIVYPSNDLEIRDNAGSYRGSELSQTLFDRSYSNASWMQHHARARGGVAGLVSLLRNVASAHRSQGEGGRSYLIGRSDMAQVHHEHARLMTRGELADDGGASWPAASRYSGSFLLEASDLAFYDRDLPAFGVERIEVVVPAGKQVRVHVRWPGDLQLSWGMPGEEWASASGVIEFDTDCDVNRSFEILASTAEESGERLLVFDSTVEDVEDCEEEVPEVIASVDPCLVGTWTLDLDAYLAEIKRTDPTRRDQDSTIDGRVRIEYRSDRTLQLRIDDYEEVHDQRNGLRLVVRSGGTGAERWGADGRHLNAIGIEDSFDFSTVIDGGVVGRGESDGPPEGLLLFPQYQDYLCTATALFVFQPRGFGTTWRRTG